MIRRFDHMWKILPSRIRQNVIRRSIDVTSETGKYLIKVASTQEELEGAYRLLYLAYRRLGITPADPSGMRCNIFQALPYTTTIIAKDQDKIIATIAVIKDSSVGFPSDQHYRIENDHFRSQGYRLSEISALAVDRGYRRNHAISLSLMKYVFLYATRYMNCSMLCATIHPRAFDFYSGLFNFRRNGKEIQYPFANNAPAIHISHDTSTAAGFTAAISAHVPKNINIHRFIFEENTPGFCFPERVGATNNYLLDPVMTPELLKILFVEKTNVFKDASPEEKSLIRSAWDPHIDLSGVPYLCDSPPARSFRYPVDGPAALLFKDRVIFGSMYDISEGGLFVSTPETVALKSECEIIFNFANHSFRMPAVVRWQQPGVHRHPSGYGVQFSGNFGISSLKQTLKSLYKIAETGEPREMVPHPKAA